MERRLTSMIPFAAAAILAAGAPSAHAQSAQSTPGTAQSLVLNRLELLNTTPLDFGNLISGPIAGTATINGTTGARTTTGGAVAAGGTPGMAIFYAAGSVNRIFLVFIPNAPITLSNGSGGTMTVSNWTSNGGIVRFLDGNGIRVITIGGRLNVGANQAPGIYNGTFNVTVNYL
ncbi:MAG: DUF4402 domain-containing protein [Sphingopyxis sp.]